MAVITNNGVQTVGTNPTTLQGWYDAVVAMKRNVWGPNYVIDPTTKQGTDITQLAELLYNAEQNNISAYAQLNINTSTGIYLDYIGLVRGILRNPGAPQEISVTVTSSTTGYTIPPSLVFRTLDGLYSYYSPAGVEITSLTQTIQLTAAADGDPQVSDGDALRTVEYFPNILSVTINPGGVTNGTETESDASYRKRILDSDIGFIGTLELMASEMRQVPGLAKLIIYSNDSDTTDGRGITPFSTEFVVAPELVPASVAFREAVAQRICTIKEPGAPLYGTTSLVVPNYMGEDKTIKFTVAERKSIEVYAKIAANPLSNTLDTSRVPITQKAVQDYINTNNPIGGTLPWSTVLGIVAGDSGYIIVGWGMRFKGDTQWVQGDLTLGIRAYAWMDDTTDIQISTNPQI